ncbi:MAG: MogA/MoaB family molybdenum cofactor biosynthesis protein [Spirochaetales bacterium]|nr:MogA/MoaB family molybdenum cofactor biosynthesis protein [Spirochaetales bacterium]
MKAAVITISDRASKGIYEDLSGPEIEKILKELVPSCQIRRTIVPDEEKDILKALKLFEGYDFILTTGGTGIGPRDITPNVTEKYCDRELPGISETLRAESLKETNSAMLSRGYSGMKDNTIIVNFPGSVKAVRLCTSVIAPVMVHAVKMILGEGH